MIEGTITEYEDKLPNSSNMLITDFWKQKVISVIENVYGKLNNIDKVDEILDHLIEQCSKNPKAHVRDIYRGREWEMDLNEILKIIHDKKCIIGANGTLTYNQTIAENEIADLLTAYMTERSKEKKLAIEAQSKGDLITYRKKNNIQNNKKELGNSVYGVTTMSGSILNSPDSASMITSQARETIAESMWILEKSLCNNFAFKNTNEFYAFVDEIINQPHPIRLYKKYNLKIPNKQMIINRMKTLLLSLPEINIEKNVKPITRLINNIVSDKYKAINFYYRYNLYGLLTHNKDIMGIVNGIMESGIDFKDPIDVEKTEAIKILPQLKELTTAVQEIVMTTIATYDRIEKYIKSGRKGAILSDTDSILFVLDDWIDFVVKNGTYKFDKKKDQDDVFRCINTISFCMVSVVNQALSNYTRQCYVLKDYRSLINLKNEFYFTSIIIFPHIKKNYSARVRLREGKLVNETANTGMALSGSNINPIVKDLVDSLIDEEIHDSHDINVKRIIERVYDIEKTIRNKILIERDITFGAFKSYRNANKDEPWTFDIIRGVLLWNRLYPNDKIGEFCKVYKFNTLIEKEENLILVSDPEIREMIRDRIFKNPISQDFLRFGLRTICIPDTLEEFPKWFTEVIDINKIVELHMGPIKTLLPGIGIYINRVNSTRSHVSSLITL